MFPPLPPPPPPTPATVTGATASLSVLGADPAGESNLTYTWSTTGTPPAAVTFSANGTNAAKNTIATFSKAGTYNFSVAITNALGLTVYSVVTVTVNQTLTGANATISPAAMTVAPGGSTQFGVYGMDQFGDAIATPLSNITWSVYSGGGSHQFQRALHGAGRRQRHRHHSRDHFHRPNTLRQRHAPQRGGLVPGQRHLGHHACRCFRERKGRHALRSGGVRSRRQRQCPESYRRIRFSADGSRQHAKRLHHCRLGQDRHALHLVAHFRLRDRHYRQYVPYPAIPAPAPSALPSPPRAAAANSRSTAPPRWPPAPGSTWPSRSRATRGRST